MFRNLVFTLVAISILAAPNKSQAAKPLPDQEQRVVTLTNEYRAEQGKPALKVNSRLTKAAQDHAMNMATKEQMVDVLDNKGVQERAKDQGYVFTAVEENLGNTKNLPDNIKAIFDVYWKNSGEHRDRMLSNKQPFTDIGVGVAKGKSGMVYVCQVFGAQAPVGLAPSTTPATPNPPATPVATNPTATPSAPPVTSTNPPTPPPPITGSGLHEAPCAIMAGERLVVFARTPKHTLQHKYVDKGGTWSEWIPLGDGELSSGPTAIQQALSLSPSGNIYVYARAMHGVLAEKDWFNKESKWTDWEFPGPGQFISTPSATVAGKCYFIFARNANNRLVYWGDYWADGRSDWTELSGEISSAPSAVTAGRRAVVFARTLQGTLTHRFFDVDTGVWSDWMSLGDGEISSAPAGVMAGDRLTVFARTMHGTLTHKFFDGTNWSDWIHLGDGEISSAPSAVMANGRLTVFARTMHGTLTHKYFDGKNWTDWIHLGDGPID